MIYFGGYTDTITNTEFLHSFIHPFILGIPFIASLLLDLPWTRMPLAFCFLYVCITTAAPHYLRDCFPGTQSSDTHSFAHSLAFLTCCLLAYLRRTNEKFCALPLRVIHPHTKNQSQSQAPISCRQRSSESAVRSELRSIASIDRSLIRESAVSGDV